MTAPVRLQLSRRKGFDLQTLSLATNGLPVVKIDRTSGFGNPFKIETGMMDGDRPIWLVNTPGGSSCWIMHSKAEAQERAVEAFRIWLQQPQQAPYRQKAVLLLRGRNLACWCPLDGGPCHADLLLGLANTPVCEAVEP